MYSAEFTQFVTSETKFHKYSFSGFCAIFTLLYFANCMFDVLLTKIHTIGFILHFLCHHVTKNNNYACII